jgi:hypothetical protein
MRESMARNWTEFVIGIIMILSPWVLGFSEISLARWCNVLIGLVLTLMSAWTLFGTSRIASTATPEQISSKRKSR